MWCRDAGVIKKYNGKIDVTMYELFKTTDESQRTSGFPFGFILSCTHRNL